MRETGTRQSADAHLAMSASLIGRSESSAFKVSLSLAGSCAILALSRKVFVHCCPIVLRSIHVLTALQLLELVYFSPRLLCRFDLGAEQSRLGGELPLSAKACVALPSI